MSNSLDDYPLVQPYIAVLNEIDGGKQVAAAILMDIQGFLDGIASDATLNMPKPDFSLFFPRPTHPRLMLAYDGHHAKFLRDFAPWFHEHSETVKRRLASYIDELDEEEEEVEEEEEPIGQQEDLFHQDEDIVQQDEDLVGHIILLNWVLIFSFQAKGYSTILFTIFICTHSSTSTLSTRNVDAARTYWPYCRGLYPPRRCNEPFACQRRGRNTGGCSPSGTL